MESGSEKSRGLVEKTVLENLDKIFQGGDELLSTVAEMMTGKDKTKIFKEIQEESTRTFYGKIDPKQQNIKCSNTQVALNVFSLDPTFRERIHIVVHHAISEPEKLFSITCCNTPDEDCNKIYNYHIRSFEKGGGYEKINTIPQWTDEDTIDQYATFQRCNELFRVPNVSGIMPVIELLKPPEVRLLPRDVKGDPLGNTRKDSERRQKRAREMENSLNYLCEYIRRMGDGGEKKGLISDLMQFVQLIFLAGKGSGTFTTKDMGLIKNIREYLNTPPEHPESSAAASDVVTVSAEYGGEANPLHE